MNELGDSLRSEGIIYWNYFQDPVETNHYIEIRIAETWTEHMRHHERVTKNIQNKEDKIRKLVKGDTQPLIFHYIGKPNKYK